MYIDINAISLCLDLNIFQQDECFCSKFRLEVEHTKSNLTTSLSHIWVICHLLPFVRVGQYRDMCMCVYILSQRCQNVWMRSLLFKGATENYNDIINHSIIIIIIECS